MFSAHAEFCKYIFLVSAVKCKANKVFSECGSSCNSVCGSKGATSTCKTGCIDGCQCPEGMSLSNGQCLHKDRCPCQHNGIDYAHGVSIKMSQCKTWLVSPTVGQGKGKKKNTNLT